jgi:hypothetical protein
VFNAHHIVDGGTVFKNSCALGCKGKCLGRSMLYRRLVHSQVPNDKLSGLGSALMNAPKPIQPKKGCYSSTDSDNSYTFRVERIQRQIDEEICAREDQS